MTDLRYEKTGYVISCGSKYVGLRVNESIGDSRFVDEFESAAMMYGDEAAARSYIERFNLPDAKLIKVRIIYEATPD